MRHIPSPLRLLPLPLALAAALLSGPSAEPAAARTAPEPAPTASEPARTAPEPAPTASEPAPERTRLYTPAANPDALRHASDLGSEGRPADGAKILAMVRTPHAVWYGDETPADVERDVRTVVRDAADDLAVPVLALYNIPGRDCSNYSGGGASTTAEYKAWIDGVARGIGGRDALVVLEPDALALLPADCGQDDAAGTRTAARYAEVNYAVDTLEPLARTKVYLDTGHPAWHSVSSIVPRLVKGGVARATGFYTNASNYQTDDANAWYGKLISACLAHAAAGGDPAECPSQYSPRPTALAWIADNVPADPSGMKHFVTDSSRNGRGPWTPPAGKYTDPQDWCNPPGRGLGARPTLSTGDPLHDARLWIKTPGESDGLCLRGTAGPEDPERGTVNPKAGVWFRDQALELVQLADPPIATR
ncbi:glycoside hydrolase family 6 protein [Streptomyces sp. V1I1]|uniref:glycoside hydrolase family 6 protein n=1 Tax=Streptomyces sp. V1I1 TaxID=3042272 RepID=UPI002783FE8D|nr:glycoside hydrolase family 6 protein [Streptomyces sp. V1I1]MDQ0939930.1 cellulase/cellobiase CelA1 [Streptomyces sp. V1I1]